MAQNKLQKLDQLKEINSEIFIAVENSLKEFDTTKYAVVSLMFVSYQLSLRFAALLKSTNQFIDLFNEDPKHELQIGLLLRPALLDILSYIYIIDEFDKMPDDGQTHDWTKINSKVEKLLADNVIQYKKGIDKFYEDKFIEKEIHKKIIEELKKVTQYIFNKDILNESNKYTFPSASVLYKGLDKKKYEKYLYAYYLYSHYSKYEHFGLLTDLMKNQIINSHDNMIYRLFQSAFVISETILLALTFLRLDVTEFEAIKNKLNDLTKDNGTK